jgi:hypothetical protein
MTPSRPHPKHAVSSSAAKDRLIGLPELNQALGFAVGPLEERLIPCRVLAL